MTAVKWAGKSRDTIEGMLAPFGGPIAGKDLDGEFFSENTDFALEWFGDWQRPMLYHHGLDPEIKTSVVGRIKVMPMTDGLWMQAQLDKAHAYYDAIAELVDQKALGLSSGSVQHLIAVDGKSGEIKAWPLIEGSLTPTPANPDAKAGYAMKAVDAIEHLAVLGVEAPDALKTDDPTGADDPDEDAVVGIKKVRVTDGVFEALADRVQWGEPDAEGFYIPTLFGAGDFPVIPAAKMSMADMGQMMMAQMVSAVTGALTPQALHDAAKASGAACEPGEPMKSEPAPLLAIVGKSAEPEIVVDLAALKARFSAEAVRIAEELLGTTE